MSFPSLLPPCISCPAKQWRARRTREPSQSRSCSTHSSSPSPQPSRCLSFLCLPHRDPERVLRTTHVSFPQFSRSEVPGGPPWAKLKGSAGWPPFLRSKRRFSFPAFDFRSCLRFPPSNINTSSSGSGPVHAASLALCLVYALGFL